MFRQADNKLAEFQSAFAKALYSASEPLSGPLANMRSVGLDGSSPINALVIYRNAYQARMMEALGEMYPATWRLLGDEIFFELGGIYREQNPSESYNLNTYGYHFPDMLAESLKIVNYPCAVDLAKFERSFQEVFHLPAPQYSLAQGLSASNPSATHQMLSEALSTGSDIRIKFIEAMILCPVRYAVEELWTQRHLPRAEATKPNGQDIVYCFYKDLEGVKVKELPGACSILLNSLRQNFSLFQAFEDYAKASAGHIDTAAIQELFLFLGRSPLIVAVERIEV